MEAVRDSKSVLPSRRVKIVAWLALPLLCAGAYWLGSANRAEPPGEVEEQPPLEFARSSLDVGEVWEDREFKHTVLIANRGTETLRVDGASCSTCYHAVSAISPVKFELPPGATQRVQVTMNLSLAGLRGSGPHRFTMPLRLYYSTPSNPEESRQTVGLLRGAIRPVLITQPVWNLGTHLKASGPIEKRYEVVAHTPLGALQIDLLPTSDLPLRFSSRRRPEKPNVIDVVVRTDTPANSGLLRGEVVLRPKAADGVPLPPKHVMIEMEVTNQDIRVSPPELYFGGSKVGTTLESLISLTRASPATLEE